MNEITSKTSNPGTVPAPKIASRKRPPAPCRAKDPGTCPYHGRLMPDATETVRQKIGDWGSSLSADELDFLQRDYQEERSHITRMSFDGLDEIREIKLSEGIDEGVAALELLNFVEGRLKLISKKKADKEWGMHRLEGVKEEDMDQFDRNQVRLYLTFHILEAELTTAKIRLNEILDKAVVKKFNQQAKREKRSNFFLDFLTHVNKELENPYL